MILSPVVLFVYNRPLHTQRAVESLQKNELAKHSELYIYSDEAKNEKARESVDEVRAYIDKIDGFKKVTVIKREKNWGLADSIIDGVTKIVNEYGKIIVLEDDLVTSPSFLKFMNDGLRTFEDRNDIFSITGFNYPKNVLTIPKDYYDDIYLSLRCMSWGWGTWQNRWHKVDWGVKDFENLNKIKIKSFNKGGEDLFPMLKSQMEGKIDSWAIRFCYAHSKNGAYCVFPVKSFINNEGFDGSGVHCNNDKSNRFRQDSLNIKSFTLNNKIKPNKQILNNFYLLRKRSFLQRLKGLISRYMKIVGLYLGGGL